MIARYACTPEQSLGRQFVQPSHPYRNDFQRDRDRIIHARAFRRLEYKTQVFVHDDSDYVRNRLTHTIEVNQMARSMARALGLFEDLSEAIALSHDLGHPPFGHAGERTLHALMHNNGGFNHNIQGLRIVDQLEQRYAEFDGLNLTFEVREAFVKHGSGLPFAPKPFTELGQHPVLEAQIVDLVDKIAYTAHDIDDAIVRRRLTFEELNTLQLWADPYQEVIEAYPNVDQKIIRHEVIRRIINRLMTDAIETTRANLKDSAPQSPDDVRRAPDAIAQISGAQQAALNEAQSYLHQHLYNSYLVVQANQKANRVIQSLFATFVEEPQQLPQRYQNRIAEHGLERTVCDYVAGMTDSYALQVFERLFGAGVV